MEIISASYIKSIIKKRLPDSHKGTYGHALLIAGNSGKMGASVIAAQACVRSGVGLVTVNIPFIERLTMQISVPEAMLNFRENYIDSFNVFSAIGIGPGIGKNSLEKKVLKEIIKYSDKPIVIDADALNIIADNKKMLHKMPANSIITPHPKEFDRLFGDHTSTGERKNTAINMAKLLNSVIVLKGYQTFVTNGTDHFLNTTGNSGLAKGGSGDALTGLITGLFAQQYSSINAALIGVYLHGLAADLTLQNQTMETMIITDIIENFGTAFTEIFKMQHPHIE
jgi:hydroxyethylthiazole kinase-like uncharacterized protein yjeF